MILVVNLCSSIPSLHRTEFVLPVKSVVGSVGPHIEEIHFGQLNDRMRRTDKEMPRSIILCGTALLDNSYRELPRAFHCLREFRGNILGICAGMHIIGLLWGGKIMPEKRIGVYPYEPIELDVIFSEDKLKKGYHLHNSSVTLPKGFHVIAENGGRMDAFKHDRRNVYGVLFHPEVLNHMILKRFVEMSEIANN